MSVTQSGNWQLSAGESIGPAATPAALDAMALRARGTVHVRPDGSVFTARTEVEGRPAFLSATFAADRLAAIELVLLDDSTLSRSDQEQLKLRHDAWLESLGFSLQPVTYAVDGADILPADITVAHPRRAVLAWGQVTSQIDPRNGGASILVRYTVGPGY